MKKEIFNIWYTIILMVAGVIFIIIGNYKNATLHYIGLGLISAGFAIGMFEVMRGK